jgi:hypothetical protein
MPHAIAVIACDKREAFAQGSASDEAIQACFWAKILVCFAEPVIGRRFAPTRWLAMTKTIGGPRRGEGQTGFPVYGIDAVRPPSTGKAWPLT